MCRYRLYKYGKLHVIIAGGGTGGHIPRHSDSKCLEAVGTGYRNLTFVGAKNKMEMEKVPQEGFRIIGLDIVGFNRSSIWKNISLPMKLIKSRMHAKDIIKQFKPNVIVGVGGYASFPMLHAGQAVKIPTMIQEQNSYAGKSNKILARKATAVCVAYPNMERFFPADKITVTGNPVRKSISVMNRGSAEGKTWFGLDAGKKTILIVGGSLGAKSINESIHAELARVMKEDVRYYGKPASIITNTQKKQPQHMRIGLKYLISSVRWIMHMLQQI